MKAAALAFCVLLTVSLSWWGVQGFARLRSPLDRLHCVTFVNLTAGASLWLAACLTDGFSDRLAKITLILLCNLIGGAAVSQRIGSALRQRQETGV